MKVLKAKVARTAVRVLILFCMVAMIAGLGYLCWSPGKEVKDGRHDLRSNGIWLQHGWLGDDEWFERNNRDPSKFRNAESIRRLAGKLKEHGIKDVFPHLCPCSPDGMIAEVDDVQTSLFLDSFEEFRVIPWVGGVLNLQCRLESEGWRERFVESIVELLERHPRLAGVQINIEPLPTGNENFLRLLSELRSGLPEGKIISVAAYPPPTVWHPVSAVHWDEEYFRKVAGHADQMVPMMYDTSIRLPKVYQNLMAAWTGEVLSWSGKAEVLLGIPAYDDAEVSYHDPRVENIPNALLGIHRFLSKSDTLPSNYSGIALYSEWEMEEEEWDEFKLSFEKR